MRDGVTAIQLGSEFDAFLFAPVDPDEDAPTLSVVSALARLDIDPWREAAELTRMPKIAANQRLTSLIAALPDASPTRTMPSTIANRLIELLPRGEFLVLPKLPGAEVSTKAPDLNRMLTVALLLIIGVLFAQWAFANLMPPPNAGTGQAPSSDTQSPPPNTSQSRGAKTIG